MTCTISRPTGAVDSFGQPTDDATTTTGVACYWWSGTPSRVATGETPGVVAVEAERILFPLGTDVQQGDRITTVTDHQGLVVFTAAAFRLIEHVAMQRNFLDCTLRYGKAIGGRT